MRQLTKEENKLTEKGLKRNKEELELLKGNLKYNKALIEKQKYLRKFDDDWREYLRKQKNREDEKVLKMIEDEIKNKEESIKRLNKQLNEGVEEKHLGVN